VDDSAFIDRGVTAYSGAYSRTAITLRSTAPSTFRSTASAHAPRMTQHGIDPDYATLGGMMIDPGQIDAVSEWLRPDDFARPLCGEVYQLLTTMRATATPIDPVTVLGELRRAGRLRSDGSRPRPLEVSSGAAGGSVRSAGRNAALQVMLSTW
jgi:hypothetical protein